MQKKATVLIEILLIAMILAVLPVSVVQATTIVSVSPTSGKVGIEVALTGTIDTPGGSWKVEFEVDGLGTYVSVKAGTCATGETSVSTTFTVPNATAGAQDIKLTDLTTGGFSVKSGAFSVVTWWYVVAVPDRVQEGQTTSITAKVTGGASGVWYNYTVEVTNPKNVVHSTWFNFTAGSVGYGDVSHTYPTAFTGADTDFIGTYDMKLKSPTEQTGSFTVGLTDKLAYDRTETVSIRGSGYGATELVTVNIGGVTGYPKNITAVAGVITDSWLIPWNASLGTYTVTLTNATTPGTVKTPADIQTFEVKVATLTPTVPTLIPAPPYSRTDTVKIEYTITYPDGSLYNDTTFSALTVSVYVNTSLVDTISIPKTNYNSATGVWNATWKIPRSATVGIGYSFNFTVNSIVDSISPTPNSGPSAYVASSTFEVKIAVLAVTITDQPSLTAAYNRTGTVTMKFNATYPDNTFYTSADLGTITVGVWNGTGYPWNLTLAAAAFDSATNKWTVSWTPPWNAPSINYTFRIRANEVKDGSDNKGPTATVESSTDRFKVWPVTLDVAAISTDRTKYGIGEIVTAYFTPTYLDGSPVTKGTGTDCVELTRADGTKQTLDATYNSATSRWETKFTVGYPTGNYTVKLKKNALSDTAPSTSNTGPAADITTTFEVFEEVTLADVLAEIEALKTRLDDLEATVDTLALKTDVAALDTALSELGSDVAALDAAISDLESSLAALSATAATTSDVDAVSSDVAAVKTDVSTVKTAISDLESSLAALSATAATTSDVDAVSSDVAAVKTDVAALDAAISDIESALDAVKTDLSGAVGGVNTYAMLAMVLALIAAIAAIASVVLIYTKVAG